MTQIAHRPDTYDNRSETRLAVQQPHAGLAMSFEDLSERVKALSQFYNNLMQEGTDYGKIPGTDKPTLYQPGAQLLDAVFGNVPKFDTLASSIFDYEKGFFSYDVKCFLVSKATGEVVAEGIGNCNSREEKYRWRNARPTCLQCGEELRRSKDKPEYYCWVKTGGCGATYSTGDDRVTPPGRVENDDPYSLLNTLCKMAQKRAHIASTLNATGAGRIFTQDLDEMPGFGEPTQASQETPQQAPHQQQQRPPAAQSARQEPHSAPQRRSESQSGPTTPQQAQKPTSERSGTVQGDSEPVEPAPARGPYHASQNPASEADKVAAADALEAIRQGFEPDFEACLAIWKGSDLPHLPKPYAKRNAEHYAHWFSIYEGLVNKDDSEDDDDDPLVDNDARETSFPRGGGD